MSRRHRRESCARTKKCPPSCRRKEPFPTREAAEAFAESLALVRGNRRGRVYRCGRCGRYYLASQRRRNRLKRGSK